MGRKFVPRALDQGGTDTPKTENLGKSSRYLAESANANEGCGPFFGVVRIALRYLARVGVSSLTNE